MAATWLGTDCNSRSRHIDKDAVPEGKRSLYLRRAIPYRNGGHSLNVASNRKQLPSIGERMGWIQSPQVISPAMKLLLPSLDHQQPVSRIRCRKLARASEYRHS